MECGRVGTTLKETRGERMKVAAGRGLGVKERAQDLSYLQGVERKKDRYRSEIGKGALLAKVIPEDRE